LIGIIAPRCALAYFGTKPSYTVTIVNEHFSQSGEHEARDNIEAWKSAISSAITIAADQVSHGNPFFGAEVTVSQGKEQLGRYLVSVGATPLKD
jgi:hypothetical protein